MNKGFICIFCRYLKDMEEEHLTFGSDEIQKHICYVCIKKLFRKGLEISFQEGDNRDKEAKIKEDDRKFYRLLIDDVGKEEARKIYQKMLEDRASI